MKSSPLSLIRSPLLSGHEAKVSAGNGSAKARSTQPTSVQAHQRFSAALVVAGLSNDRAARRYGVTRKTIANWRSGATRVPAEALIWAEELAKEAA